jgi:hypothetical protein
LRVLCVRARTILFSNGEKKNIRKFYFFIFWCRTDIFVVLCKYRVQEQEEEEEEEEFIESCVSFIQMCSRTEKGNKQNKTKKKSNGWAIFPCASFFWHRDPPPDAKLPSFSLSLSRFAYY